MIAVSYALLAQAAQQRPALRSATEASETRRQLGGKTCKTDADCKSEAQKTRCGERSKTCVKKQPTNGWKKESACLDPNNNSFDGKDLKLIDLKGKDNYNESVMTRDQCLQACQQKNGATACQWYDHQNDGEFGSVYNMHHRSVGGGRGGSLGNCFYITRSTVYDCAHVNLSDDDLEWGYPEFEDVCLEDYDGSTDQCIVFDEPVSNTRTTCTGADFQAKMAELQQTYKPMLDGTKLFGCGSSLRKKNCQWGCKPNYRLVNGKKGKREDHQNGTKSGYTLDCIDGKVITSFFPKCEWKKM